MAKAAVLESSVLDNLPFGRRERGVGMKRITPSELRGEQLKRKNCQILANEAPNRNAGGITDGPKKAESLKVPRYVDTRVDAVYQVKKSSERCRVLYGNEKLKEPCATKGTSAGLADLSANRSLDSLKKNSLLSDKETSGIYDPSTIDTANHGFQKIERCSQSVLRHVAEVHLGCEKSDPTKVDMEKALKGLAARESIRASIPSSDSLVKSSKISSTPAASLCSQFQVAGHKAPLDFTLKTRLLLVSSSSVKWCHALNAHPAKIGISQYISKLCPNKDQNMECASSPNSTAEALYSTALNLWLYPQSSLPASVISAMSLLTANGEVDFLSRRRQDWGESFRNLYYMVRKNLCNMFYVYTRHFVILFLGGKLLGQSKQSCNAFISQSTRGLRSLLRKHDLKFSMPLCRAEAEQAAEADLIELSEIEKRNVGQTVHLDSFVGVDNDPQSLLAFIGNESVHGLYDFLLNHRFLLPSLASDDVPALYSPVPFQNASLCVPEVRCKEMKMANSLFHASNGSDSDDGESSSASSVCYSIEIKDTILPPWIISRICAAMNSDGRGYDMSFTTDHNSKSLNAALVCVFAKCNKSVEPNTDIVESGDIFGIPEAIVTPRLHSAFLKHLKYSDGAHLVDISRV